MTNPSNTAEPSSDLLEQLESDGLLTNYQTLTGELAARRARTDHATRLAAETRTVSEVLRAKRAFEASQVYSTPLPNSVDDVALLLVPPVAVPEGRLRPVASGRLSFYPSSCRAALEQALGASVRNGRAMLCVASQLVDLEAAVVARCKVQPGALDRLLVEDALAAAVSASTPTALLHVWFDVAVAKMGDPSPDARPDGHSAPRARRRQSEAFQAWRGSDAPVEHRRRLDELTGQLAPDHRGVIADRLLAYEGNALRVHLERALKLLSPTSQPRIAS